MIKLFLLLLLVQGCLAALVRISVKRGVYETVVTYDPSRLEELTFVKTHVAGTRIFVMGIVGGIVDQVLCRQTITTQLLVAPRGCDGSSSDTSLVRTNCGQKTVQGLLDFWTFAKEDAECIQGGPDVTCLGPPLVLSTGRFDDPETEFGLLQGVAVVSGVGPRCAIPALTKMWVEMPSIRVNSSCSTIEPGTYEADIQAAQASTYTFWKDARSLQLTPLSGSTFKVTFLFLGKNESTHSPLTLNQPFTVGSCAFLLQLIPAPRPLRLIPKETRIASNYYKTLLSDSYYRTSACNLGVGRRRFDNGRSIVQSVPESVPYGGIPVLATDSGVPIAVTPDPRFVDVDLDCARFYPKDTTFRGFGFSGYDGPVYDRSVPATLSCYAPFPFPEKILEVETLDERAKQCRMLGAMLATDTSDVCVLDSWRIYCKIGWLYFDERCWYKFDSDTESGLKVTSGIDSDRVCARLNPHASAILSFPMTTSAWLQRFFVHYKYLETVTRVVIYGRRCECYSEINGVTSCSCDDPQFPLCSYHIKDVPLYWTDTDYHPKTLSVLKYGQEGVPQDGKEIRCECFAGSTGPRCERRTCVAPMLVAASINASLQNPLLAFFKRCYTKARGMCKEDVDSCVCAPGYGPPSSLAVGEYTDTPCSCPSLTTLSETPRSIAINGRLSTSQVGVCGFAERGECLTVGWNDAKCLCQPRKSLTRGTEPAWLGKGCSCPAPHFQPGSNVVEGICNRRGTCCPHGERMDKAGGDCHGQEDGCRCDDGYTGSACTARVPFRLQAETLVSAPGFAYVRLKARRPVRKVYVSRPVTRVTLSDTVDGEISSCVQVQGETWEERYGSRWECTGSYAWIVKAWTTSSVRLSLKVFEFDFAPGGVHVNPYSGRFFASDVFKESQLQPFTFSQFGVTTSHTVCAPGYTGETCAIGISAFRLGEGGVGYSPRLCGESTQPRRGQALGDVCECTRIGDGIAFYGDSCECAMVDGKSCGGVGQCVAPVFSYGSCASDIQRLAADILHAPYTRHVPQPRTSLVLEFSVLSIQGVRWGFPAGTVITLHEGVSDVDSCQGDSAVFSFSYQGQGVRRVQRLATIFNGEESFVWDDECPKVFIPDCVQNQLPNEDTLLCRLSETHEWSAGLEELSSGEYQEAMFVCVKGTALESPTSPYGLEDCADPLVRVLNDLMPEEERVCSDQPIRRTDNTLGVGYGLFHNYSLGVDFSREPWGEAHYRLLSGVLGNVRCGSLTSLMHAPWLSLFRREFISSSVLPNHRVRAVVVTPAWPIQDLVLKTTRGRVCGRHAFPTNQTVSIQSSCTPLEGVYNDTHRVPDSWLQYMLLPDLDLDSLRSSLYIPASPECALAPALNILLESDRAFLRRVHSSQLAPRRCSSDAQCAQFEDSVCVLDSAEHIPWLNGDPSVPSDSTHGEEGGCDCSAAETGFFHPQTFCSTCVPGYGPDTEPDYIAMHLFNARMGHAWMEPSVLSAVSRCTLPVDPDSTRVTTVCGGKGRVVVHPEIRISTTSKMFVDASGRTIKRRCDTLKVDSTAFALRTWDSFHPDIFTYQSSLGRILTVIYSRLYLEGQEVETYLCVSETKGKLTLNGVATKERMRNAFTSFL